MIDTVLQEKLLQVVNDHYKDEEQNYDSFILYAFHEENDDMAVRAIFHRVGVIKMMGAYENLKNELHDSMDDAYAKFKKSQMH